VHAPPAPTGSVVVCRGGRYDKYYMLCSILLELRLAMISYVRVTLRCLYVKMLDVVLAQVMSIDELWHVNTPAEAKPAIGSIHSRDQATGYP